MSAGWGVSDTQADTARSERPKRALDPKSARAGHQGIAWLHISGIAIWLLVCAVFGALIAAGKNVPGVIIGAGLVAAAGHALFLAVHLFLASAARRRAQQAKQA